MSQAPQQQQQRSQRPPMQGNRGPQQQQQQQQPHQQQQPQQQQQQPPLLPHPQQHFQGQPPQQQGGLLPHPQQFQQQPQQHQGAPPHFPPQALPPGMHANFPPQQFQQQAPPHHQQQQFQQGPPHPQQFQQQGPPPPHFQQQQQGGFPHQPPPAPHAPPAEADPFLAHVVSASLVDLLGKQTLVLLRDGRKLLGELLSFDQYSNIVLSGAHERKMVGTSYYDDPLGLYIIRGENVVLLGDQQPGRAARAGVELTQVSKAEFAALEAEDRARKEAAGIKIKPINRGEEEDLQ